MMRGKNIILLLFLIGIVVIISNLNNILKVFYPIKYSDYVYKYAAEYKLDPYLVEAVIKSESNFDANAKSEKDAYGLMQITPSTAEWAAEKMGIKNFSVDLLYNPEFNIRMGCWYLNDLNNEFNKNTDLVLAAYNGGRGNVKKWLNNQAHSADGHNLDYIPFKETDKYVKKVNTNYSMYKKLYIRP